MAEEEQTDNEKVLEQNLFVIFKEGDFNVYLPGEYGTGDVKEQYLTFRTRDIDIKNWGQNRYSITSMVEVILTTPLAEKGNHTLFEKSVKGFLTGLNREAVVALVGKSYKFRYMGNEPKNAIEKNHSYTSTLVFSALDFVKFS